MRKKIIKTTVEEISNVTVTNDKIITFTETETTETACFRSTTDDETFWQTYTALLTLSVENKPSHLARRLFSWILLSVNPKDNSICMVKTYLDIASKRLEVALQSVKNALTELVKEGWLIKNGKAVYVVNPEYAWKGTLKERNKQIKFIVNLKANE